MQSQTLAFLVGLDAWRTKHGGALPPLRDPTAVQEIMAEAGAAAGRLGLEGLWGAPFVLAGAGHTDGGEGRGGVVPSFFSKECTRACACTIPLPHPSDAAVSAEAAQATLAGLAPVALPALETLAGSLLAQELVKVHGVDDGR